MSTERCICCGAEVPEGRQVCHRCERISHGIDVIRIMTGIIEKHVCGECKMEYPCDWCYVGEALIDARESGKAVEE